MALKNDKIVSVSCGLKHTIARTSLGRVYTWGWNGVGQLGTGDFENRHIPILI
jgi:alpha-tubulin suppressor-like RCC1 family protein